MSERKGADGRCAGRSGRGRAARGGARDSLGPAVWSAGYPNEAAAEVVLTALREWLEQHKDKVRPGSGRRERTEVGGGAHVTSTIRHLQGVCRALGTRGSSLVLALCVLFYSGPVFLLYGQGTRRFEKGIAGCTSHHEPLL